MEQMKDNVILKMSIRNMFQKKGRTLSIFIGMLFTIFLLTLVVSIYSYVQVATGELLRNGRAWDGDAGIYVYSKNDISSIKESKYVRLSCEGYHLGAILDDEKYVQAEVAYYTSQMAEWMHCNPIEGRMPENENEVVVSDDFLEKTGVDYCYGETIKVSYDVADENVNDSFRLVGYYEEQTSVKDMILISESYYLDKKNDFINRGKTDAEFPVLVEVQYKSNQNFEGLTKELINSTSLHVDTAEYIVNEELENPIGIGMFAVLAFFIGLIFLMGYFFIANVYAVSMNNDIHFFHTLRIMGVDKKELWKILLIQMNATYIPAIIVGIAGGIIFSNTILLSILSAFMSLKFSGQITREMIIIPIIFSYIVLIVCQIRVFKRICNDTKARTPKIMTDYRVRSGCHTQNLLHRMILRRLAIQRKNVVIIAIMLFSGVLIGNVLYTYIKGFDVEKYLASTLFSDYTIHSASFSSSIENRKDFSLDAIKPISAIDGVKESGGAAVEPINIKLDSVTQKQYEEIDIDSSNEKGNMYTYLYGLDRSILKHAEVLDGNLDYELFYNNNYVVLDSLGLEDTGVSCWKVGDKIEIPISGGGSKEYTVMAIVSLPYDLSYQSKWEGSSDIFLPMDEWRRITKRDEYYIYSFNVEDNRKSTADAVLEEMVSQNNEMVYESAKTKADDNMEYFKEIKLVMLVFMFVIIVLTMSSFFNIMINEMISLKNETVNLQRIGVDRKRLIVGIVLEGSAYVLLGIVTGVIFSPFITRIIIKEIIAKEYVVYGMYGAVSFVYVIIGVFAIVGLILIFRNSIVVKKFEC